MKPFKIISPVDSLELSCLLVEPAEGTPVKAIIQFSHGMCEHKERYILFMEFMAGYGYACVINDHRGHGASVRQAGDLGYLGKNGWDATIEDTKALNDWVKERYPGINVILLGHSMGSLVARSYAKRYDDTISSLFVCGCPSDRPMKGAAKILPAVIGLFCGWHFRSPLLQKLSFGANNKPFSNEKSPNAWVCSDEKILKEYDNDPLCQYIFTANGFYNLLSLMQYCYSPRGWAMKNPLLPVHFISGALDPCRVNDRALMAAVNFMKKIGYVNVDLKTYPGMRHEILNETDRRRVWNDILQELER